MHGGGEAGGEREGGGAGQCFVRREAEVSGGEAWRREAGCRRGGVERWEAGWGGGHRTARGEGGAKRRTDARACVIADARACRRGRTGGVTLLPGSEGLTEPRHYQAVLVSHAPHTPPSYSSFPSLPRSGGWALTSRTLSL